MSEATKIEESLDAFIVRIMRNSTASPTIEFCVFSGAAKDWKKDGGAIFLRLVRTGVIDGEGNAHELWARLYAPCGIFVIPDVPTEMLAIIPPDIMTAGAGWCFYGAQLPPQSVTQAIARWTLSDNATMCASAGGWAFRGGPGGSTFISIDKATGDAQMSTLGGTHIALSNSQNTIELQVTDGAKPASQPLTTLRLDANGISMTAGAAALHIGADGTVTTSGSGAFVAAHPGGCLGTVAGSPIGLPGGAGSITWKIAS